jgi:hypothetical protein
LGIESKSFSLKTAYLVTGLWNIFIRFHITKSAP